MENFYKTLLEQKLLAKDLMIKGFKQTFGISYADYSSNTKLMKGVSEEIEALDDAVKYYAEQAEKAALLAETETGVQNG